jgi:putative endonuclease
VRRSWGIYGGAGCEARRNGSHQIDASQPSRVSKNSGGTSCHPERSEGSARIHSRQFSVYILASATRRLYVGVTSDLPKRIWQHKTGLIPGFTRRYGITRLVYVETTGRAGDAIAREKQIKGWLRQKKITLIESQNPEWRDLAEAISAGWRADPSLRSG